MPISALLGISTRFRSAAAQVPSQCTVCHAWPAQRVCGPCLARFAQPVPRCRRCALPVPQGVAVCGACTLNPPLFDACLAAVDYAYPWAGALADFKFNADPGWAPALARLLLSTPGVQAALATADVLLPVPLSPQRLRERGYNQSALLAQQLVPDKADVVSLLRVLPTEIQHGLPRAQRLRNLRGAFAMEPARAHTVHGRYVVLVDDVMTTGATLHAATEALREAGAAQITAIVLARTGAD